MEEKILESKNFIQLEGHIRSIQNNLDNDNNVMIRINIKTNNCCKEYFIDCFFYNAIKRIIEKAYKEGDYVRVRGSLERRNNMFYIRAVFLKKIKKD